jgi:nucleotide-binding universal stress UspA family protein
MYHKILVPLDQSKESEGVLKALPSLLSPGGRVVLMHVIPPGKTRSAGQFVMLGSQQEEEERDRAMVYLKRMASRLGEDSVAATCSVVVSNDVVDCISNFAVSESVDLIVMYTHDRKGLAKILKGSVSNRVQHRTPIEVRVIRPRELAAAYRPSPG